MPIREAFNTNPELHRDGGLYLSRESSSTPFEQAYLKLREKEHRLYTDDLVKNLPEVSANHPLRGEWAVRKKSTQKLVHCLRHTRPRSILEVGCGNGWLSYRLATELPGEVCGLDINEFELRQAARLFIHERLTFVCVEVWSPALPTGAFDAIVLASSIHYFPDLKLLLTRLFELLRPAGEVHILDSPLYASPAEADSARRRSLDYFSSMGYPGMADHYFHHTFNALFNFNVTRMHNPDAWLSRVQRRVMRLPHSPFPWIRIQRP